MKERERKHRLISKDKFEKFCESKIKTTMIGAIAEIEKEFNEELQDKEFNDRFNRIREAILDRGNGQIRSLKSEILNYIIEYLGHDIEMRIFGGKNENR